MTDRFDDKDTIAWRQVIDNAKAQQSRLTALGLAFSDEAIELRAVIGRHSQAIIRRRQLNAREAAKAKCHQ